MRALRRPIVRAFAFALGVGGQAVRSSSGPVRPGRSRVSPPLIWAVPACQIVPAKAGTHSYNCWLPPRRRPQLRIPIRLRGHGSSISGSTVKQRGGCASAFPRRKRRPGFASFPALEEMRAQGRPGARCTRGLVCNCALGKRTRAYRYRRSIPAFPAQWLYGL
jgi:hypothetical protein